jgi:catechol 2,3-dioxygenase-like lactoylglutathione lyase family enzyme
MQRTRFSSGAGRTSTGFPPNPILTKNAISNRNWKLLEIVVTPTKHSPTHISNRNENTRAWSRSSCLRNDAHTSMNWASATSTPRVAQAGVGLCPSAVAVASASVFPPSTSSRGPFTGRRLSLRICPPQFGHAPDVQARPVAPVAAGQRSALTRQLLTWRRQPAPSNRHWKGLEIAATPTKQSSKTFLIDNENALFPPRFEAQCSLTEEHQMISGAHIVIQSKNPEADRAFFRDVLGFASVDAGHGWLVFALPPSEAAFHPAAGNGSHELYFLCDNLKAEMTALTHKGIALSAVHEERWGSIVKMSLPGGGHISLYQPKHPTAFGLNTD